MADEEEPEPEEYVPVGPRYPCDVCGRSFAQETLEKHTPICAKHAAKRRRVFDSSKQRLQELEEALPKKTTKKVKASSSDKRPSSKWKEDHRELVSTVREARVASAKRSSVTTNLTGGNEKCPHCDRSFGPKAIERHVSFCKELKARIPQSPLNSQAKERQDARLKYKVPTGKSQRSLTREKYSPGLGQIKDSHIMSSRLSVASTCSTLSTAHGMRTPSTGRSPVRQSTNGNPLKENQNSSQSSHHRKKSPSPRVWQRSPSPSKNRGRSTNSYAQDSQESSSLRARVEPEGGEDDLSSSCNLTRAHRGVGDDNRGRKHKQAEDRESTTSNDSYDPYAFAERQMMELLGLGDFHPSPKQPTVLETSPTSAFSKYKSSKDKRPESPTKQLMISGVSTFTNPCQVLHGDVNRNIDNKDDDDDSLTLSLNNLTICSPISVKPQRKKPINCEINLDNQLNETDPFLSVNRIALGKKNSYPAFSHSSPTKPTVQRSISLFDAKPAVVRRQEKRKPEDWKQMMNHASNSDEEASSPDSAANRRLSGGKPSGDSAYSSLNRKSPYAELNKETQLEEDLEAHLSSSDSEASLPSICLQNDSTRGREKSPFTMPSSPVKLPKFCHECGTKYPIQFAKFCCECGVRRLVL